ncbi:MAG: hypothetical protein ACXW2T_04425, partial [Allosphingosinicella sp.]
MNILDFAKLSPAERRSALARPRQRRDLALQGKVREIVDRVRDGGWTALVAEARRIDGEDVRLEPVSPAAGEARALLAPDQVEAIELAARNI